METIETGLVALIAKDNIEIPISSISGKLKRAKPKLAQEIGTGIEGIQFQGERAYARIETSERMKARGMREGIEAYCAKFPQQGKILNGMIEEQRVLREKHLYFGLNEGSRISSTSYMGVMTDLGFTDAQAANLYPAIMDASRRISEKRGNPERSILIG